MPRGITVNPGKLLHGVNQKARKLQSEGTSLGAEMSTRLASYNLQAVSRFMLRVFIDMKEACHD